MADAGENELSIDGASDATGIGRLKKDLRTQFPGQYPDYDGLV